MRVLTLIICSLVLFGCSKPGAARYADEKPDAQLIRPETTADPSAAADAATAASAAAPASAPPAKPNVPAAATGPMLAYSYQYGLEAPPNQVRALIAKHQQACVAAGFAACQLTGSSTEQHGKDNVRASLTFRATPAWLAGFKAHLSGDADAVGGRIIKDAVTSEDLSRQMIDTEAALRAKTTLRDRLQSVLESRPGKTADLVDVETALAKVQGELDATQSEMTVMRQRIATSDVTVEYFSQDVIASDSSLAPLSQAVTGFVGTVASGLAALIGLTAWLLPWVVVVGGLGWVFRKRLPTPRWPWRRKV